MEVEEVEEVRCDKCGAEQSMAEHLFAGHCTFCGAAIVSKSYASRRIRPKSLVPFQVNRERAADAFRRWVRAFGSPRATSRKVRAERRGTHRRLPALLDLRLQHGERLCRRARRRLLHDRDLHDAQLPRASRSRRPDGSSTRAGRPPRARGEVPRRRPGDGLEVAAREHHRFRHALQPEGAGALPAGVRERLPGRGVPGDPARGFPSRSSRSTRRCARSSRRDIGGDQQRIHSVSTRYSEVKFKHVLLPAWISAYRYRDKVYRFPHQRADGRGLRREPEVLVKIAFLALGILVVLFLVLLAGGKG